MRYAVFSVFVALASFAHAHPGHVAEEAGHTHWIAVAAIVLALGIGLWAGIRKVKANRAASIAQRTSAD